jgi:hypothetical protein
MILSFIKHELCHIIKQILPLLIKLNNENASYTINT